MRVQSLFFHIAAQQDVAVARVELADGVVLDAHAPEVVDKERRDGACAVVAGVRHTGIHSGHVDARVHERR